jgi:predicted PurR-regulated permease PerM
MESPTPEVKTDDAAASEVPGVPGEEGAVKAHFRSARWPSTPFWIAVLAGLLVFVVFMATASALFILIIGVGLAFFLVPAVDWLEQRGIGRTLASILCVGGALVVTILLLGAIAIILVEQGVKFVEDLPVYLDELGATYRSLDLPAELRSEIDALIATAEQNVESIDEAALVAGAIGGLMSIVGGALAWLVLPFFLFYVVRDQPKEEAEFYAGVPLPWRQDVHSILTIITDSFANYFKAEFIVGGIMFVLVTAGMLIIGVVMDAPLLIEFAFLLGLIALIMEMVPQIGPILSYIPALIVAIPSGLDVVIVVSVFYFVVFNIEGSILVPKIEGDIVEFSGAAVLVLIAIGFALGGMLGAIVALPLASIIRDLFHHFFDKAVEQDLVIDEPAEGPTVEAGEPAT